MYEFFSSSNQFSTISFRTEPKYKMVSGTVQTQFINPKSEIRERFENKGGLRK
jgi:hypothetical protein